MAEQAHGPGMPQPPEGFQRPGIPGAGNLLDPEVRGEIREKLHGAVQDAAQKARGGEVAAAPPAGAEAEGEQGADLGGEGAPPARPPYRAGPYPHGDVDLRSLAADVPAEPIRPQRARAGRQFYFLPCQAPAHAAAQSPPDAPAPGPRPD